MPSYHIWIRKEDEEFWKEIQDKPSFIHAAIDDYRKLSASGDLEALKYIVDDRTQVITIDEPTITDPEDTA